MFLRHVPDEIPPLVETPREETPLDAVAVIQGKYCLAYAGARCTDCFDSCPEVGAIELHEGLPMVNVDFCTGCRVCYDICPAYPNAIRMVKRPTRDIGY